MGHVRVGRLPKTGLWKNVVELLTTTTDDIGVIADTTAKAAQLRIRQLRNDASFAYCFWLLTRIASASRDEDFARALAEIGVEVRAEESALSFISNVSRQAGTVLGRHPESGPFSELASLSMRRALTDTIGLQGASVFESSIDDLRAAFRRYSTPAQFGVVATLYFGDLFARTLRFYVDRELANSIGAGHALTTADEGQAFADALDLYARQTARIVEQFAEDWYSKRNWQDEGKISLQQARRFTAYAIRKLEADFTLTESE
jgi:hypothetical protein